MDVTWVCSLVIMSRGVTRLLSVLSWAFQVLPLICLVSKTGYEIVVAVTVFIWFMIQFAELLGRTSDKFVASFVKEFRKRTKIKQLQKRVRILHIVFFFN